VHRWAIVAATASAKEPLVSIVALLRQPSSQSSLLATLALDFAQPQAQRATITNPVQKAAQSPKSPSPTSSAASRAKSHSAPNARRTARDGAHTSIRDRAAPASSPRPAAYEASLAPRGMLPQAPAASNPATGKSAARAVQSDGSAAARALRPVVEQTSQKRGGGTPRNFGT
jgi:hypothetical protein